MVGPRQFARTAWCLVFLRLALVASFQRAPSRHSTIATRQSSPPCRRIRHVAAVAATPLGTIDALFQASPYATAAITCGIKASSADWVAQKRQLRKRNQPSEEAEQSTDLKRNIAFLLYGAIYQGMAQEYIYNHLYPTLFGAGTSVSVVLSKVAFDLMIQTTLVTLPIAYLTKALVFNYSAREALRRYRVDILKHGLLTKYYTLWGPIQCITFSVVPEHYRVSFIACVSFFWLIILSTITSRSRPKIVKIKTTPPASMEAVAEVNESPACELVDGLTCNIDG